MQKIMEIRDVFELPKNGVFIVGMNTDFESLSPNEIRSLIGKNIVICSQEGDENTLEVVGVDIPISMQSKKCSINICVGHSVRASDLKRGSIVYGTGDNI